MHTSSRRTFTCKLTSIRLFYPPAVLVSASLMLQSVTQTADLSSSVRTLPPPPANFPDPFLHTVNGMGGHRLFAWSLDGIAAQNGINLITFDRPSSGGSTPVQLSHRVEWTHFALVAILHDLPNKPTTFSLLSHSNGIIYALYTLLHLPKELRVKSWHLTSPYIAPWLSGSVPLTMARWIPAKATSYVGVLVGGALKLGLQNIGWTSGLAKATTLVSSGISGLAGSGSTLSPTSAPVLSTEPDTPERERARFIYRNAARPPHKRLYGRYYFSQRCVDLVQSFIVAEGTDAFGPEALLSFRIGEGGDKWGWETGEARVGDGEDAQRAKDEMMIYERGLRELAKKTQKEGEPPMRMQVVFGTEDGLVPEQGREYFKELVVGKLGLVDEKDWREVDGAGHDEVLGLEQVVGSIFEVVLA
ncbi:hypothetical protein P7C70_g8397, partial [Phenoliferia sp. Uapishka_3]